MGRKHRKVRVRNVPRAAQKRRGKARPKVESPDW